MNKNEFDTPDIGGEAQFMRLCHWKGAAVYSLKLNEKSCPGCRRPTETELSFKVKRGFKVSFMPSVLLPWVPSVYRSSTGVALNAPCLCALFTAASRSKDRWWDDLIFRINLPAASSQWKQVECSRNLLSIFNTSDPTLSNLTAVIVFSLWTRTNTTLTLIWDLIRRNGCLDAIGNTRAALWVESLSDPGTGINSLDMFCLETGCKKDELSTWTMCCCRFRTLSFSDGSINNTVF